MKTVNISTLKAKLSAALRQVRDGDSFIVLDRDIPVAEIRPYHTKHALEIRKPVKKFSLPVSDLSVQGDPLTYLMEDRGKK